MIKSKGNSLVKKKERYAVPQGGQNNLFENFLIKFARKEKEMERKEKEKKRNKKNERTKEERKKERKKRKKERKLCPHPQNQKQTKKKSPWKGGYLGIRDS